MKRADKYSSLRPVYALNILGESHFRDKEPLRIFTLYDRFREKTFEKEWISGGYFEIIKEGAETDNQEYWRQYFLGNTIPDAAPDYIHRAKELVQVMNMDNDERRIAYLADKEEQRRIGEILYAEEQKDRQTALNLLSEGDSLEKIARVIGRTEEEITELIKPVAN
jgi:hypothetical protein